MANDDTTTERSLEIKDGHKTIARLTIDRSGGTHVISGQDVRIEPMNLGQQPPRPVVHYFDDPACPIENVFYDESFAYLLKITKGKSESENHVIGITLKPNVLLDKTEWSITVTETGTNANIPVSAPEVPSVQTESGIPLPSWLRFRFTRRYQTKRPEGGEKLGLYDARLNEIDRHNKEETRPDTVAERTIPRPMDLRITRTVRGQAPQTWLATIDLRVQQEDTPHAAAKPAVRPSLTQLCQHRDSEMPPGYKNGNLPEGVVPRKGGCKTVTESSDGSLVIQDAPDVVSWNQLSQEERAQNLPRMKWYPVGYNSRVVCRYDRGVRVSDPNRVAVEVLELSPVTTFDNLSVEVGFDGESGWHPLPLMGIILSGTETGIVRGANNFLTFWRFRGLPETSSLQQTAGFRLRIRDMSIHQKSLTWETGGTGSLPVLSGHPFWRTPSVDEEAPGADLVDLLTFSEPLKKFRFLFVLDHSGSMQGARIANTRTATAVALAELAKLKAGTGIDVEAALHAFQNTVDLNPQDPQSVIRNEFSGWKAPDDPALIQFLDAQTANGATPLYQAVKLIPNELGQKDPYTIDYVIVLSDGMHNVQTIEYKKKPDGSYELDANGGKIPIPRDAHNPQAGASAVAELVTDNRLPDKMIIVALELPEPDRTAIRDMGREAPVYLDQELSSLFGEHAVSAAARTTYLQRMQARAGSRRYLPLKDALQLVDAPPDGEIPATEKTKLRAAVEKRGKSHVEVKDVDDSSKLAETFRRIVNVITRASVACVTCQEGRIIPSGLSNYRF
jgi:hypothetical protein